MTHGCAAPDKRVKEGSAGVFGEIRRTSLTQHRAVRGKQTVSLEI